MSRSVVIAPVTGEFEKVCFFGPSGIATLAPEGCIKDYNTRHNRFRLYNGAEIWGITAEEPDRLRGPEWDIAWGDEVSVWRRPEAWDYLTFAVRSGARPRKLATFTPKATPLVRKLIAKTGRDGHVITRGTTYDNKHLPQSVLDDWKTEWGGTRLGRQELDGILLDDIDGALWTYKDIDNNRVSDDPDDGELPPMDKIVVAIDPPGVSDDIMTDDGAEAGVVVAGLGMDKKFYILADLSRRMTPEQWARAAVSAYHMNDADLIVGEVNYGGEMVASTVRNVDASVPFRAVRASRGKIVRAQPISALV